MRATLATRPGAAQEHNRGWRATSIGYFGCAALYAGEPVLPMVIGRGEGEAAEKIRATAEALRRAPGGGSTGGTGRANGTDGTGA